MEHIFLFLAILALVKSVWATSLWPGKWSALVVGGICASFIAVAHGYVLGLGKPGVDQWISDYKSLLNLSLWIMLDLISTAALCRTVMQDWLGVRLKYREKWMLYCPSVVVFPALLYLHISLFYWFPGMDFEQGSTLFALFAFVFISGGIWGIRKIFSEIDLRLELTALLALLLFVGVVVCTVLHPSVRISSVHRMTNWLQTFEVLGVMMILPLLGWVFRKWIR